MSPRISQNIQSRTHHEIDISPKTTGGIGGGRGNIVKGCRSFLGRMVGLVSNPSWSAKRPGVRQQGFNAFKNILNAYQKHTGLFQRQMSNQKMPAQSPGNDPAANIELQISRFLGSDEKQNAPLIAATIMERAKTPQDANQMAFNYILSGIADNGHETNFSALAKSLGVKLDLSHIPEKNPSAKEIKGLANMMHDLLSGSGKMNHKEAFKTAFIAQNLIYSLDGNRQKALATAFVLMKNSSMNGLDVKKEALNLIVHNCSQNRWPINFTDAAKSLGTTLPRNFDDFNRASPNAEKTMKVADQMHKILSRPGKMNFEKAFKLATAPATGLSPQRVITPQYA